MTTSTEAPGARAPARTAPQPPPDRPRRLRGYRKDDVLSLVGSGFASLALTYLLAEQILPVFGLFGFLVFWYLMFLVVYATVVGLGSARTVVVDRLVAAVIHGGALVVGGALVSTVFYTFFRGWSGLTHLNMYVASMSGVDPQARLSSGGVGHAILGTAIELAIAVTVSLPMGVGTAVFMSEVGGWFARVVRTVIEAMTALPDILAGLFVYIALIIFFHFPKSGLPAGLAISVTMLPVIARASDVVLRVVPGGLREAGLALGASQWQVIWRVVLPTVRPGLATALILGVARGVGETAPVLLTSGASTYFNGNPLEGTMNSLPLFVFSAVRSGQPLFVQRGFAAASILLALVLVLFAVTRWLARPKVGNR